MALPPRLTATPGVPGLSGTGIKPGAGTHSRTDSGAEMRRAQREAREQIAVAHRSVVDAQHAASEQIDGLKDEYRARMMEEHDRQTRSIEQQQAKGYEQMRELKQRQEAEINRLRRDGERKLAELEQHYSDQIYKTEKGKRETLHQLHDQVARETDHVTRSHQLNQDMAKTEQGRMMEILRDEHALKIGAMEKRHREEYDKVRENYEKANEQTLEKFEKNYQTVLQDQQQRTARLFNSVSQMIRDIREDSSRKLAAYGERQSDPFYQLLSLDAKLYEDDDAFIIEARIPPHERDHVTVAVKGDQVILNGQRRNSEELEIEPGRKTVTHSFQSFTETFPIDWPVEERGLSKFFDGDDLIVYIPKQGKNAIQLPHQNKRDPERLRIERPRFPENLGLDEVRKPRDGKDSPDGDDPSRA